MSKLLIIDDEEGIRKVLSVSLANDGYDVSVAAGGEEGIEIFKKESPSIILTDIKMPGMDGVEALKQIKKLNPDAEVIMITGHGDMDSAIEALKLDASDFLNKPIKDEALSVALKRAEERITIKKKLEAYTYDLENMVRMATELIFRINSSHLQMTPLLQQMRKAISLSITEVQKGYLDTPGLKS